MQFVDHGLILDPIYWLNNKEENFMIFLASIMFSNIMTYPYDFLGTLYYA